MRLILSSGGAFVAALGLMRCANRTDPEPWIRYTGAPPVFGSSELAKGLKNAHYRSFSRYSRCGVRVPHLQGFFLLVRAIVISHGYNPGDHPRYRQYKRRVKTGFFCDMTKLFLPSFRTEARFGIRKQLKRLQKERDVTTPVNS
ncbi:uncharacterized protein F4822DRAFT_425492 [Hypoxylon trugodes]|uniref:uncharacterized protein n=1 Tax=Hypoxylon trugodes TaxID=326681 RepID=UPI0021A24CBD|nr:uncharacterized protein F4822DRAFT_425492 [Hypoxylon trugodes]KAI1392282.1 hypothetical protein F4822DRAFT_425492 [Hypoxylon trugodes]